MGELIMRLIQAQKELDEYGEQYGSGHLHDRLKDAEHDIEEYILNLVKGQIK